MHAERTTVKPESELSHKQKFPDHWERYTFALDKIVGDKILDIACGPGYGTAFLAKELNKKVIGLDIDLPTINEAIKNYGEHADFIHVSGYTWPIPSNSVDTIISFETFEHLDQTQLFLKEARRVLKFDGIFILSTPLNENSNRFNPENPFHIREYNWFEFEEIVSSEFKIKSRFSQISRLGIINKKIKKRGFGFINYMIPVKLKNILKRVITTNQMKKGIITEGKEENASVQLIIAIKK